MFKIEKLSKSFKTDFWAKPFLALNDLSFEVSKGELVGFLGANGAGKTTTIKIMLDFIRANNGSIQFDSKLGKSLKEVKQKIGYVAERPYYYPDLTGREFIHYMGSLRTVEKSLLRERQNKLCEELKITFALDRKIRSYSKGMLQRLGFVCALIHDPELLILDEPLSGLDPIGRKEIKEILKKQQTLGKTIFFSSHIVSDVEEICDKVVVLDQGRLLYSGSIDQLIEEKMHNNFEITYIRDELTQTEIIPFEQKQKRLAELCHDNVELLKLVQPKPTLEEIIYHIRS